MGDAVAALRAEVSASTVGFREELDKGAKAAQDFAARTGRSITEAGATTGSKLAGISASIDGVATQSKGAGAAIGILGKTLDQLGTAGASPIAGLVGGFTNLAASAGPVGIAIATIGAVVGAATLVYRAFNAETEKTLALTKQLAATSDKLRSAMAVGDRIKAATTLRESGLSPDRLNAEAALADARARQRDVIWQLTHSKDGLTSELDTQGKVAQANVSAAEQALTAVIQEEARKRVLTVSREAAEIAAARSAQAAATRLAARAEEDANARLFHIQNKVNAGATAVFELKRARDRAIEDALRPSRTEASIDVATADVLESKGAAEAQIYRDHQVELLQIERDSQRTRAEFIRKEYDQRIAAQEELNLREAEVARVGQAKRDEALRFMASLATFNPLVGRTISTSAVEWGEQSKRAYRSASEEIAQTVRSLNLEIRTDGLSTSEAEIARIEDETAVKLAQYAALGLSTIELEEKTQRRILQIREAGRIDDAEKAVEAARKQAREVEQAAKEARESLATSGFAGGLGVTLDDASKRMTSLSLAGERAGDALANGLGDAFSSIATNAESAGEAFEGFGRSVINTLLDIEARWAAGQLVQALGGALKLPGFNVGAASAPAIGGASTYADAVAADNYISGLAEKGPVTAAKRRFRSIDTDALGEGRSGGGGLRVEYHDYGTGIKPSTERRRGPDGENVVVKLKRMIADDIDSGGEVGRSVERSYGLRRRPR